MLESQFKMYFRTRVSLIQKHILNWTLEELLQGLNAGIESLPQEFIVAEGGTVDSSPQRMPLTVINIVNYDAESYNNGFPVHLDF